MATNAKNLEEFPADHAYLVSVTLQACEVARNAVATVADALAMGAPALFLRVDEAEKKLDELDWELDERLSKALGNCPERQRRELISCMKFMTDLERIGDLISTFASGARALGVRLEPPDVQDLIRIASVLEKMLGDVEKAFSERDLQRAVAVLRADAEIDRMRNLLFVRHVENPEGGNPTRDSIQVLFMAQSLERAGDHTKNLAEEVCHLVSGHTLRHVLRANGRSYEQMFLDWLRQQQGTGLGGENHGKR
jgi:phosphate transport system protein